MFVLEREILNIQNPLLDLALNIKDFEDIILRFWLQQNHCCRLSTNYMLIIYLDQIIHAWRFFFRENDIM